MVNKIILVGRLGKDPEVKVLENGSVIGNFTMATSRKFKNKAGEVIEQTQWHSIVLWSNLAELAEKYLSKGKLVYIEGEVRYRSYEDKKGEKRYITEIYADQMRFLESSNSGQSQKAEQQAQTANPTGEGMAPDEGTDDLPFVLFIPIILSMGLNFIL